MRWNVLESAKHSRVVTAVAAVLTLAIITASAGYFLYLDRGIQASNDAVHEYANDVAKITDSLSDLRDAIGYGGLIHEFKNYIIRRDDQYARRSEEAMDRATVLLEALSDAYPDERARRHLSVVREMVLQYRTSLDFALNEGRELSIAELDSLVRIDDRPALKALDELDLIRSEKIADDLATGDRTAQSLITASEWGMLLVGLVALFGGLTLYVLLRTNARLTSAYDEIDVLIREAPTAILGIDEQGRIQRCNQNACDLLGFPPDELIGLQIEQALPTTLSGDEKSNLIRHLRPGHADKSSTRDSITIVDKEGQQVSIEIDASVIRQGGRHLTVAFIRDVSAEQQQKLKLIEASRRALEANAAKSRFMATMSHELRTPLNAVIGFSELVQIKAEQGAPKDVLAGYAKNIGRSGTDLLGLINDILDFAKIDSGKFDVAEEPIDISELLGNVHSGFEAKAKEFGVDLRSNIGSINAFVLGDAMRLKQVLYNLLDNAIKFGKGGTVEFGAQIRSGGDSFVELAIRVSDQGIGIHEDRIESIFDPFHQADATIAREFGGTGLGLSISRSLTRLMGGDITVESEPGAGSVFTATFRLKDLHFSSPESYAQSLKKAEEQDNDFGLTVLLVDDVEPNLDIAGAVLSDVGCVVAKARNGQEAVEWCRTGRPDLILMDIHMPIMDGIEAASMISGLNNAENVPSFFAWTADVTSGDLLKSSDATWRGVITKPTVRSDLIRALKQVANSAA
ncbi:ATP-binding protein [Hwanghaeella sp.]|uniref:hybrid sensor histidine kinase/response regulator n=1 Tax=Hwanghaeella sp. TaxID=2605943 RepID=UPI003CCB9480